MKFALLMVSVIVPHSSPGIVQTHRGNNKKEAINSCLLKPNGVGLQICRGVAIKSSQYSI